MHHLQRACGGEPRHALCAHVHEMRQNPPHTCSPQNPPHVCYGPKSTTLSRACPTVRRGPTAPHFGTHGRAGPTGLGDDASARHVQTKSTTGGGARHTRMQWGAPTADTHAMSARVACTWFWGEHPLAKSCTRPPMANRQASLQSASPGTGDRLAKDPHTCTAQQYPPAPSTPPRKRWSAPQVSSLAPRRQGRGLSGQFKHLCPDQGKLRPSHDGAAANSSKRVSQATS